MIALTKYRLCEKFGWTPQELGGASGQDIADFLTIMRYEGQRRAGDGLRG